MSQTLDMPILTKCVEVKTRVELGNQVLEMQFLTEDITQVYKIEVTIDPLMVLDGQEALTTLFRMQRDVLPEASHAAWDEAVDKIKVVTE